MSPTPKRKRRKPPEEDLAATVADIINSPITRSNLSFLHTVAGPSMEPEAFDIAGCSNQRLEHPVVTPTTGRSYGQPAASEADAPSLVTQTTGYSNQRLEHSVVTDTSGCSNEQPAATGPEEVGFVSPVIPNPQKLPPNKRRKVRQQRIAQDGHTTTEEIIYKALWDNGQPDQAETRVVGMGIGELARRVRMEYKNCKLTLIRLMDKLAIQLIKEEVRETATPRTYRVFSYRAILERRKDRGMTHYVRTPRAIIFVNPDGSPLSGALRSTSGYTNHTPLVAATHAAVTATGAPGVGVTTRSLVTPTPEALVGVTRVLENSLGTNEETTTTIPIDRAAIAQVFSKFVNTLDDHAIEQLITSCQEQNPDAITDEIIHFLQEKGRIVLQSLGTEREIQNPTGFLLSAVPVCFGRESLTQWRKRQAQGKRRREAVEAEKERQKRIMAEVKQQLESAPEDNPWVQIDACLKGRINPSTYDTWFHLVRFLRVEGDQLLLFFHLPEYKKDVQEKFSGEIIAVIRELDLPIQTIRFLSADDFENYLQPAAPSNRCLTTLPFVET